MKKYYTLLLLIIANFNLLVAQNQKRLSIGTNNPEASLHIKTENNATGSALKINTPGDSKIFEINNDGSVEISSPIYSAGVYDILTFNILSNKIEKINPSSIIEKQSLESVTNIGNTSIKDIIVQDVAGFGKAKGTLSKDNITLRESTGRYGIAINRYGIVPMDSLNPSYNSYLRLSILSGVYFSGQKGIATNTSYGINTLKEMGGEANTGYGANVMTYNANTGRNSAFGTQAGRYLKGEWNTLIGALAASHTNFNGKANIVIGHQAGRDLQNGNNNILIENILNSSIVNGNRNIVIDPVGSTGVQNGNDNLIIGGFDQTFTSDLSNNLILGTGSGAIRIWFDAFGQLKLPTAPIIDNNSPMLLGRNEDGNIVSLDKSFINNERQGLHEVLATNNTSVDSIEIYGLPGTATLKLEPNNISYFSNVLDAFKTSVTIDPLSINLSSSNPAGESSIGINDGAVKIATTYGENRTELSIESPISNSSYTLAAKDIPGDYKIATTDQLQQYKSYTGFLNQYGDNPPEFTQLENSLNKIRTYPPGTYLSGIVNWIRLSPGKYRATIPGLPVSTRIWAIVGGGKNQDGYIINARSLSPNTVDITTYDAKYTGTGSNFRDEILESTPIEIRVYQTI